MVVQPLKGLYGNYTLTVQAQDLGIPPNSVTTQISICVTDFNDNTPRFINPQHNTTIRVPEVCDIMYCFWEKRAYKFLVALFKFLLDFYFFCHCPSASIFSLSESFNFEVI